VGVVVSNLEHSVNFYTNILGMVQDGGFEVDGATAGRLGLTDEIALKVITLKTNKSPGASQWKLMSFDNTPSNTQGNYINDRLGMRYITLFVNDLAPVLERVKMAEVPLLGQTPQRLDENRRFILIQDPDGIFIEVIGK
jgi:catechol 2,3-dioxygenase-like lactoylglutathione lyase family enzyme